MPDPPEVSRRAGPFRFGLLAATGALLIVIAALALHQLFTVLTMLTAAAFLAIGLNRPVEMMMRRGMKRGAAIALLVLGFVIVGGVGLAYIVPKIVSQTQAFFGALPALLHNATDRGAATGTGIDSRLGSLLTPENVARLATGLLNGAASLAGLVFIGVTTIMLTLFLLGGYDRVHDGAYKFVPATRRDRARRLGDTMLDNIANYLVGSVMVATFAAIAALVWCLIVGLPYPLMLGLVVGVADMIPQIGATIGSTVVILVALSQSWPVAIATLVFFLCYQGIENWGIYPRVMSRAVKISNLAAIVSALIGGSLLGVFGVLVAVPVYASVQLLIRDIVFPAQDAH